MSNPVALITGASVGIGEQFSRQLADRGHDVVLVARDSARLEALAKEIEANNGVKAEVLAADLTDPSQLATVEARVRSVDLLVNNAGFGTFGSFHTLDVDAETREINLNVIALVRLTHAAAAAMAERGRGGILNVSSLAGFQPGPSNATYSATKAFVTSFTEAVHEEMKGTGVSVCALCPGFTRTEFQVRANAPAGDVPGFMWQEAPEVARAGLDGLAKNRAVVIPGTTNKVLGNLSAVTPHAITRRLGAAVLRRATH
ncbi:MAG TPA: SDR family oxidoreductase [Acidimicrobiia bacterium]|nr:SDR family oxidoreductase [Acidimicrobiia bacterium]